MTLEGFAGRCGEFSRTPSAADLHQLPVTERYSRPAALGLVAHAEPRAAYAATPRFAEPVCTTLVEDLPEEPFSNRGTDFLELRLLSLKSHFFSRTYCFPRLESSPDSIISAINRLTIGREQPIISARSSWPSSGIRIVPSESCTPARVAKSLSTIVSRSQNGRFNRVAKNRTLSDQKVLRDITIEMRTSFG